MTKFASASSSDSSLLVLTPEASSLLVSDSSAPTIVDSTPTGAALELTNPTLILASETLDDLEATRIANENRLRSLRDVYGLTGSRQEAELAGLVDGIRSLEKTAELSLKRALRRHPLSPWVFETIGVGEKQGARLLAVIGDPYMRPEIIRADGTTEPARPRRVSELWAYCGFHVIHTDQEWLDNPQSRSVGADLTPSGGDIDHYRRENHTCFVGVAPARARGQQANWSMTARSRTWLIASKCIMFDGMPNKNGVRRLGRSPYRDVYDAGREKYANAVHPTPCRRCGPAGRPALTDSPLSDAHKHARALRLVSKAILKDLWLRARYHHETG